MTFEEFWEVYDEAFERAEDGLVQFICTPTGVVAHHWSLTDWSPVRSAAVSEETRAYYHVLAMHQAHYVI